MRAVFSVTGTGFTVSQSIVYIQALKRTDIQHSIQSAIETSIIVIKIIRIFIQRQYAEASEALSARRHSQTSISNVPLISFHNFLQIDACRLVLCSGVLAPSSFG